MVASAYPPVAFQFAVGIGESSTARKDSSFREVSGIGPEMETETVAEGGENRFVHVLPKAMKHPRLSLRRGIATLDSPLVAWCQKVLEGGLAQAIVPKPVHVFLLDENGEAVRAWSFENAWPVHWEVEGFNATKNEVAVEKIEL
ncbi:MAG TPA: phage tail protein, partial [Rhizobacter sp.]|nr:phage tail protein [Rhizobacter sp.]